MNTQIKVSSDCRPEKFNIQAAEVLFDGFLKLYMESQDDEEENDENAIVPEMHVGDRLEAATISAECKFTQAPYRYSLKTAT